MMLCTWVAHSSDLASQFIVRIRDSVAVSGILTQLTSFIISLEMGLEVCLSLPHTAPVGPVGCNVTRQR